MKGKIFLAAVLLVSQSVSAQNILPTDSSLRMLDEVIVTPNKFEQKQNETGKVVNIIPRELIEKSYGKSIAELLNEQTGLVVNGADNAAGTNQTIYLRGASSANTLILLDGVPLYDASGITSEFDLNNFSLANIERIEILKGAQSTLYGSDAVSGVINIITKKGDGKPLNFSLEAAGGSYETFKGNVAFSGDNGKGQTYYAAYSRVSTAGISSAYDSTGKTGFDKDGFQQDVVQFDYGFNKIRNTRLSFYAKYNDNHADIDAGPFTDDKDFTYHNQNLVTGVRGEVKTSALSLHLNYNYNIFDRRFEDDSTDVGGFSQFQKGRYKGQSQFAEAYTKFKLGEKIELLAGADARLNKTSQEYIYLPDYGFPATPISDDSAITRQLSLYGSLYFHQAKGFNMEAGGRLNFHNLYGTNATYTLNPFFLLSQSLKLYANVSSGYRVPSLYQLYSEYGNRDLKPETTTSLEAGVQYLKNSTNLRVTAFRRDGKDIIIFFSDPITYASNYVNADKQAAYGVEAEAAFRVTNKISLNVNYTFADGQVTTSENGKDSSYFNLYKRPRHNVNISVRFQPLEALYFSAHLKSVSKSFEPRYQDAPYELKGYYKIDFYSRYTLCKYLSLFADLQNITGQQYFMTRGFTTKGFNVMLGAQLKL